MTLSVMNDERVAKRSNQQKPEIVEEPNSYQANQQPELVKEATVRVVAGTRVLLDVDSESVWATLALAYCYQPAPEDKVLVIGSAENRYIVGVLQSSAQQIIRVQGDLSLHAEGRLNLTSNEGVHINGPTIGLKSNNLVVIVNKLTEKYQSVNRAVKNELVQRLGKMRTTVDSVYRVKAERIVERAEKDVSIDGNKINLG